MGVPVASRCGARDVTRLGLSISSRIGFGDLIVCSLASHGETAVALAGDMDRLHRLCTKMRERRRTLLLMEHTNFAHEPEVAYHALWRRWREVRDPWPSDSQLSDLPCSV